jgi:crotonobetainyl-CoA:carnitine CoA-transferase CaiB-like acyl-CoA transferase
VNSLQQALEEPQLEALGLTQTIRHPARDNLKLLKAPIMVDGTLAQIRSRPPLAGEHTAAILGELGYSAKEVAALLEAGAVGMSPCAAARND